MTPDELKKGNELQEARQNLVETIEAWEDGLAFLNLTESEKEALDSLDIDFKSKMIEKMKAKVLEIDQEFDDLCNILKLVTVPAGSTLTGITVNTLSSEGATVDIGIGPDLMGMMEEAETEMKQVLEGMGIHEVKLGTPSGKTNDGQIFCDSKKCAATYKKYIEGFLTFFQDRHVPAGTLEAEAKDLDESHLETILRNLTEQEEGYKVLQERDEKRESIIKDLQDKIAKLEKRNTELEKACPYKLEEDKCRPCLSGCRYNEPIVRLPAGLKNLI